MRATDKFNARRISKRPDLLAQIAFAVTVPSVVWTRDQVCNECDDSLIMSQPTR